MNALLPPLKIRCSSLHKIIGEPKSKNEYGLTQTAMSYIQQLARENLFGYTEFDGSKHTEKGQLLEDQAIKLSGFSRGKVYKKNTERRENDWITGECDIFDAARNLIIDTKCPWSIGSHPFFQGEAEEKAKKAGYDIQMQGYMWLWDCKQAEIDFCLLPTPEELLASYDNRQQLIDIVAEIPQKLRITTLTIARDDKLIGKIQEKVDGARRYYEAITEKYTGATQ